MKLTPELIQKLGYLQKINDKLLLTEGNVVSVKNGDYKLASVSLEEPIPTDAAIYQLQPFLGALKLFDADKTELTFNEDHIVIKSDSQKARYNLTEERLISTCVPTSSVFSLKESGNLGEELFSINFSAETFNKVSNNIKAMLLPHLSFCVTDGMLKAIVCDKKNKGENSIETVLGSVDSPDFEYVYAVEDFTQIPQDNYNLSMYKDVSSFILSGKEFNIFLCSIIEHTTKVA